MPLGSRFMDALRLAAEIHGNKRRKGTDLPYIGHLMAVCALVIQAAGDEEEDLGRRLLATAWARGSSEIDELPTFDLR